MDKKITQLTALVTPALEDELAIVDDPAGTPETKKIALSNLFLDENDMVSNSQTQGATQRSIKTYVDSNPYGGWLDVGIVGVTVTRVSTDNPTVNFSADADIRDYIWKGSRVKMTENGIVHNFIVSADPVFTSPNTTFSALSEIDTATPTQAKALIGAGAISAVAYAPPKTYPKGFPIAKQSWTLYAQATGYVQQTNPTQNVWYNPGSILLVVPIGDYDLSYKANHGVNRAATDTIVNVKITLSTANNSESDSYYTSLTEGARRTASQSLGEKTFYVMGNISITTKQTRYINLMTAQASMNAVFFNDNQRFIQATSTLL